MSAFNNLLDQKEIMRMKNLTSTERWVACVALSFRNADNGWCAPAVESDDPEVDTLTGNSGYSRQCVTKSLRALVEKNVIRLTPKTARPSQIDFIFTRNEVTRNNVTRNEVTGVPVTTLPLPVTTLPQTNKKQIRNKETTTPLPPSPDSFAPDGANPVEAVEVISETATPDLDAVNAELAALHAPEVDTPHEADLFPAEVIEPAQPAQAVKKTHPRRTPRAFPLDAVLDAYAEICPQFPQPIRGTLQTTSKRYKDFRKGWDFFCQTVETENGEALTPARALEYWRRFLEKASANNFLNGRTPRGADHANWRPKLDYLLSERGINLVLEGARR